MALSLKPTLELNKNKEFENINSIIIDTIKIGRQSVINIVTNKEINEKNKVYLLQQENLKLLDLLHDVTVKLNNIEKSFLYSEFCEEWTKNIDFEIEISKTNIDFLRIHRPGYNFPIFLVNKKDYSQFISIAKNIKHYIKWNMELETYKFKLKHLYIYIYIKWLMNISNYEHSY